MSLTPIAENFAPVDVPTFDIYDGVLGAASREDFVKQFVHMFGEDRKVFETVIYRRTYLRFLSFELMISYDFVSKD